MPLLGNYSFLRRIDNEENKYIFESAYPPYYYSTSINPNEMSACLYIMDEIDEEEENIPYNDGCISNSK